MRKGYYFTLDALFGTILIGMALILSAKYFVYESNTPQIDYLSQDIISCFSNIRISEVNDPYVQSLISSEEIINLNNSILEQIGEFYVLNKTEMAENLSRIAGTSLIPEKFGFEVKVNDETIFLQESLENKKTEVVSSRRLISGIEKFKPLKGATSKVFLEGIQNKRFSSYLYFGGFIGQGNITVNITDIPSDADISNVELELDAGGDFDLYIDGILCDQFTIETESTIAERWNITSCKNNIHKGEDTIVDVLFDTELNQSFISGGFLRVDYSTQELIGYFEGYKIRYNFPGIDGIVNLYDAFYVPGTITSMDMNLHFNSNDTSFLTVGGRIIHEWPGSLADQTYNITNQNLSTIDFANLDDDYPLFSNNTVPIRFASYDVVSTEVTGGNADVIVITDYSGSMKNAVEDWSQGNLGVSCDPSSSKYFMDDPHVRRLEASMCLNLELVSIVMNYTGNRVWPVYIYEDKISYYDNPNDKDAIMNNILKFSNNGKGKTCIACALNQAYDLLDAYSNSTRKKFIVLMTDGTPTHCADGSCLSTSTDFGVEQCEGLCDFTGMASCTSTIISDNCDECTINTGATENAYFSAERAFDDLNATIFTIGFGPIDDCVLGNETLKNISEIGNGTYQFSNNITELREIYQNISYEILERVDQVAQKVNVKGNLSYSTMYPDSYIEIEYIPIAEQPSFDEIAVSIEEEKFDTCNPSFDVPQGMRVTDAKVTSYSGVHWTDYVIINGKTIYNISEYFLDYVRLGDPFFVYVPVNNIQNGTNTLAIETADSPENKTGCSQNNTIIYTGLIKSSISYADVLPKSDGCTWTVEFEDGTTSSLSVPSYYSGTKICSYTSSSISYDMNDSIDSAAYQLFDNLDYDDDGRVFVKIDEYNLVVNAISVQMIPYPWGPAIAEVNVWR